MSEAITITESQRLVALETIIKRGLSNFIETGEALSEIRDSRLYRIEHDTFEDYCQKKWGMTRRYASHLMGSSEVAKNLGTMVPISLTSEKASGVSQQMEPMGSILPTRERQARPLTKLPAEQQPAAWDAAVEAANGKQPTARQVEAAVRGMIPAETPEQTAAGKAAEDDSETLWSLKSYWKKANKKDRAAFLKWCSTQN